MKNALGAAAALIATTGLLYAAPTVADAAESGTRATSFAFKASGYGTRASGGDIPAGSDSSAFQAFGCTNRAGIDRDNYVAVEELPGVGRAEEITPRVRTTARNGRAASTSTNSVARVVLAEAAVGTLDLRAVNSVSRAFYDGSAFRATARTTVGDLTFTPPGGAPAQELPVPSPGEPVEIPGVATISVGAGRTVERGGSSLARADGVRVDLVPSGTTVRIAHTGAQLERGVRSGLLRGRSVGASGSAIDEALRLGRSPLALMPCTGTDGDLRTRSIAKVELGPEVVLRNLSAEQLGEQSRSRASGYERGRVGRLELTGADVLVRNIVGKANVVRTSDALRRNARGTTVGEVIVQGEEQEFPDSDVLEIPGVAKLERSIVRRTETGIHVIALRVTLLDGSGAVLNLGEARLAIRRAAR